MPVYHGVRRLYEGLELEYTTPGATCPVRRFLDEAAKVVPDKGFPRRPRCSATPGERWSALASRALETAESLGEYTEVAEQRLAVTPGARRATSPRKRLESRQRRLARR